MSADETIEREALTALLSAHPDNESALQAMQRDGWLDLLPEEGSRGIWSSSGSAARAVATTARLERAVPVAARLIARALQVDTGAEASTTDVTYASDATQTDGMICATAWSDAAVTMVGPVEGAVYQVETARIERSPIDSSLGAYAGMGHIEFQRGAAQAVTRDPDVIERLEVRAALLLAADALGACERALDMTLSHARDRLVFGASLATFQAIQHRLVDMHMSTTLLAQAVAAAAEQAASGGGALEAWTAKSVAGRRGIWIVEQAIQLHGGMGFTWERGLQWSLFRAQSARHLLGGRQRAATIVLQNFRSRSRPDVTDWSARAAVHASDS